MALLYMAAGVNHFVHPETYLKLMPPFLPWHHQLVMVSGVAELLLGFLLCFQFTRKVAAWGLVALLIAVYPANIYMAINYHQQQHPLLWAAYLRLPLQFLLIWWAYIYTKDVRGW